MSHEKLPEFKKNLELTTPDAVQQCKSHIWLNAAVCKEKFEAFQT